MLQSVPVDIKSHVLVINKKVFGENVIPSTDSVESGKPKVRSNTDNRNCDRKFKCDGNLGVGNRSM